MQFQLRSQQDIVDFTMGCCFYGTGGGGDPQFGLKMLQEVIQAGKVVHVIDEIAEDELTACAFLMGSSGPSNTNLQKKLGLQQKTISNMSLAAMQGLLDQQGKHLGAIVPIEIGGAATASAAATAAWLDVPLIDGDYAGGRALPEIVQTMPAINGLSFCPLMSVDAFGNQILIKNAVSCAMEERLGKMAASASYGLAGQAGLLQPFSKVKASIQTGTLSRAFKMGKAIRQSAEAGNPMIPSITENAGGKFVITGRVLETKAYEKDGYYFGEQIIQNNGDQVRLWFKNEYLQLWKNDEPLVVSPDLICVVDYPSGKPLINAQIKIGDTVAIFAISAPAKLKTAQALQKLQPSYFDFDFAYKPFEAAWQKQQS